MRRVLFVLLLGAVSLCQAATEFKLSAAPGPHAVGVRTVHQYDYSRVYRARVDLFSGQPYTGERARPMQTMIWYPAAKSGAKALTFADYLRSAATEETFERTAGDIEASLKNFGRGMAPEQAARMLASPMLAVRDAKAAAGKFPLVVYAPSFNAWNFENADLCEYLASHGYVVISSPSMGARTRGMTDDLEGVETQAADIAFLIGYAHTLPQADTGRVAVAGFSWGGMANVFAAARDSRIKALVSLDGSVRYFPQLIADAKYVTPARVAVPMLFMAQKPMTMESLANRGKPLNASLLNEMRFSDVYINTMYPMEHGHFSGAGLRMSRDDAFGDFTRDEVSLAYSWTVRYVGNFLDAYLKDDKAARAFLANTPVKNGMPAHMASMDARPMKAEAPTLENFAAQLGKRGFGQAIAIFEEMRKLDAKFTLPESTVNMWGYNLLAENKDQESIEVFKLNTLAHPESGNTFDSLAEAYQKAKMNELAIKNFKRSLELDPQNANAVKHLKTLGAGQ
jgi:dienelactone hydrolase